MQDDTSSRTSIEGPDALRIVPFPGGKLDDDLKEGEFVTALFHTLNRVLPEDQKVVIVSPTTTVADALRQMKAHGYSQVPVVSGKAVLGLFSHQSFSERALWFDGKAQKLGELPVSEFVQPVQIAHVSGEFRHVFDELDRRNAVILGDPERLLGVVTTMDVLRYLFDIAIPYVHVAEIELALRALIKRAVDGQAFENCCQRALSHTYAGRTIPGCLEEMTFDDYVQLIGHGDNWQHFAPVFGGVRITTRARLVEIRNLRNDIFHFRKELSNDDHDDLRAHRDWVLQKARQVDQTLMKGA